MQFVMMPSMCRYKVMKGSSCLTSEQTLATWENSYHKRKKYSKCSKFIWKYFYPTYLLTTCIIFALNAIDSDENSSLDKGCKFFEKSSWMGSLITNGSRIFSCILHGVVLVTFVVKFWRTRNQTEKILLQFKHANVV